MGDNILDGMIMDLDLNRELSDPPSGPVFGFGSLLSDLETPHNRIEERIQRLEVVGARVRERNRWRHARNFVGGDNMLVDRNVNVEGSGYAAGMISVPGRGWKRDCSHLVAKALEMDCGVRKVDKEGRGLFDCNICLEMAREPVLTCCGHLYCWMCFFQVPYVYSTTKECPVCRGEVTDANVTPIYGNGDNEKGLESDLKIPQRPKARRIESAKQQHITRGLSRIERRVDSVRLRYANQGLPNLPPLEAQRQLRALMVLANDEQQSMIDRLSSELSQLDNTAASSTENIQQRNSTLGLSIAHNSTRDGESFAGADQLVVDSTTEIHSPSSIPSSSQANDVSDAVARLENLTTAMPGEINLNALHSSSQRLLSFLRLSDIDSVVSRETRRRRLN